MYLSYGLISGKQWYVIYGVLFLVVLFILTNLTMRYFTSEKVEKTVGKDVEDVLKPIQKQFIDNIPDNTTNEKET
jgi:hypothetical protein